ncbi:fucolectin-5-like [Procambarus clarkii]|uniref:fucolectin-5-like n=1 Tax=Procambarus clarkii TaxID=6728 RepID=UPI0037431D78
MAVRAERELLQHELERILQIVSNNDYRNTEFDEIPKIHLKVMGGSVWARVWVWALVIIQVGAQKTMFATWSPSSCLSTVTAPQTTYSASSTIQCAALGKLKGAQKYIYNGSNTCTLVGEGLVTATSGQRTFFSFPSRQQVATGKPTYGSPYLSGTPWVSSLAVDGVIDDNSMYHSDIYLVYPWWVVDLAANFTITEIQIFSRTDCCSARLHNVEVRVGGSLLTTGNFSSYVLFSTYLGPYAAADQLLSCPSAAGVTGRYVSIQRVTAENDMLQLVEVYIYATTP